MDNNIFELDFTSQEVNNLLNKTNDINYTSEQINALLDKINNLEEKPTKIDINLIIPVDGWIEHADGYFYIDIQCPDVLESDNPFIDIEPNLADYETDYEQWSKIIKADSKNGYITIYAKAAFESSVTMYVNVIR